MLPVVLQQDTQLLHGPSVYERAKYWWWKFETFHVGFLVRFMCGTLFFPTCWEWEWVKCTHRNVHGKQGAHTTLRSVLARLLIFRNIKNLTDGQSFSHVFLFCHHSLILRCALCAHVKAWGICHTCIVRLKERFLIIQNKTKCANFRCNHLFWATHKSRALFLPPASWHPTDKDKLV